MADIQTRNENGELLSFPSLKEAFTHAKKDRKVNKISFSLENERVRLIRTAEGWLYEDIFGDREI